MKKKIRLNAFAMNCVAHQSPGLWTHPRDRTSEYNRLPYWTDLARTLERGRFDGLFLADVLGVYDVFGGSPDAALRNATQTPANEPLMLIPAMAAVTEHLGFGVTSNLSYEPPYTFARRMSTLDHLTEGRVGWNVVTGYLDSAARGAGKEKQTGHDDRYDVADEYMEVVYKLWEGSWEGRRRKARIVPMAFFTDPATVHRVQHVGNNYRLDAIHLCEPSPQRTPVLYQAGTSPRGRQFAAEHAECVFMSGPSAKIIAPRVAGIRDLAAKAGRNPAEILMFSMFTIILGRTEAEAQAKYADYVSHVSPEGALPLMSGWTEDLISRRTISTSRFATSRTTPTVPQWTTLPAPIRIGCGPCAKSRSMSASAASALSWSARRKRSPTPSRHGSTRPTSMASMSPSRFRREISRTLSTCWCRNRFGAGVTRTPTQRERCAKNCSARAAPGSPRHIRRCSIGPTEVKTPPPTMPCDGGGAGGAPFPCADAHLRHRWWARCALPTLQNGLLRCARNDGISHTVPSTTTSISFAPGRLNADLRVGATSLASVMRVASSPSDFAIPTKSTGGSAKSIPT